MDGVTPEYSEKSPGGEWRNHQAVEPMPVVGNQVRKNIYSSVRTSVPVSYNFLPCLAGMTSESLVAQGLIWLGPLSPEIGLAASLLDEGLKRTSRTRQLGVRASMG
jgi:hypothetical protein